jgi:general secretion pathway protein A
MTMYAAFYGLSDLPFRLSPDERFFFGSSGHGRALAYLTYGLDQADGFIVITGDIGAGKTTLVEHLLSGLNHDWFVAARVVTTQLDADDTVRMVATAFGIPANGVDKASLLSHLQDFLTSTNRGGKRSLLLVDEAQNLSIRSLEELRMLSNFAAGHKPLLQSFLLGQRQFRATIAKPELEQLRQRVIAFYHLGPLRPEETRDYIHHRLRTVGWQRDPQFVDDVFPIIHQESGGVPRRINTLCSRLMLSAYLDEAHVIDRNTVRAVARDLAEELPDAPRALAAIPTETAPADLDGRVAELERKVCAHDRAIAHALRMTAEYLEKT